MSQRLEQTNKHKIAARLAIMLAACLSACPSMAQNQGFGGGLRERFKARMDKVNNPQETECTKYKIAGLDVAVWKPQTQDKAPLVIFSHGFGGANTQSVFIMKALAQAGYLVVAPNHKDAHGSPSTHFKPEEGFAKVGNWSDATYQDRRQDIVNLLAALHADPDWDKQIDWSKLALSGHSLGGYTMLGLGGAWPSWKIDGVKAVLALSPYCTPFTKSGDLSHMAVPVMYQGGTRDLGITPFVKGPRGAFSQTASPAYFVDFDGFNHLSWTGFNRHKEQQELVNHYCIAFLDKYVKGSPDIDLQTKLPGVAELEVK